VAGFMHGAPQVVVQHDVSGQQKDAPAPPPQEKTANAGAVVARASMVARRFTVTLVTPGLPAAPQGELERLRAFGCHYSRHLPNRRAGPPRPMEELEAGLGPM
jgi:hypothetical protein